MPSAPTIGDGSFMTGGGVCFGVFGAGLLDGFLMSSHAPIPSLNYPIISVA